MDYVWRVMAGESSPLMNIIHISEITCPLYAPAKRKEQGQKFTQNN